MYTAKDYENILLTAVPTADTPSITDPLVVRVRSSDTSHRLHLFPSLMGFSDSRYKGRLNHWFLLPAFGFCFGGLRAFEVGTPQIRDSDAFRRELVHQLLAMVECADYALAFTQYRITFVEFC